MEKSIFTIFLVLLPLSSMGAKMNVEEIFQKTKQLYFGAPTTPLGTAVVPFYCRFTMPNTFGSISGASGGAGSLPTPGSGTILLPGVPAAPTPSTSISGQQCLPDPPTEPCDWSCAGNCRDVAVCPGVNTCPKHCDDCPVACIVAQVLPPGVCPPECGICCV